MPEGHTVHRIALQFAADFVGHRVAVSSPQGRFAAGAALLDGGTMTEAQALGKHLFLGFETPSGRRVLRVHLGLYGAWDFHGRISPITAESVAVGSMGAPRLRRAVRMGEGERALPGSDGGSDGGTGDGRAEDGTGDVTPFPPAPVGQVRVRIMTEAGLADLRGPTACEVLTDDDVARIVAAAGPDPRLDASPAAEQRFVDRLTSRRVAVGQLIMDQAVVSGIGNIYRAEMLFRAELDPWTPGRDVPSDLARMLWKDWVELLDDGVRTGVMLTRPGLEGDERVAAIADPTLRHAVYGRAGEPCLRCGAPVVVEEMAARKLYRCPGCQRRP